MNSRESIPALSKSRFLQGIQCYKFLWFALYEPEQATELNAGTYAILDQGTRVGEVARSYFPNGALVGGYDKNHEESIAATQRALKQASVPALYEAAFSYDDVRVRVDILVRVAADIFDIVEVKSSTSVKPEHIPDLALQAYVLNGARVRLRRMCVLTVDTSYVYQGGPYEVRKLFKLDDVTDQVNEIIPKVSPTLQAMRAPLWALTPPEIAIGDHCYKPNPCQFIAHCHPSGPKHPVAELPNASAKLKKRLADEGIKAIDDIPNGYGMSETQERVRAAVISGRPYLDPAVDRAMEELSRPIYFLDFETVNPALPMHKGMHPYQVIPFQWSAHRLDAQDRMTHHQYLHENSDDPREEFLSTMLETIGTEGSICVYSSYEQTQLKQLKQLFPQYSAKVDAVIERMVDLLPIVRKYVYHPDFHGSFSIKSVLPALVRDAGWHGLAITDGSSASSAYVAILSPDTSVEQRESLRHELSEYCKKDTEAMVKLFEVLKGV